MKRNIVAYILLSPFSIIYGALISLRNLFYEAGLLKSTTFSLPVINVGNLSLGGTGKTPHIEYLIKILSPYINVATLSRGYKRKSKGFRMIRYQDNAQIAGDEPLQFKRKHPHIPVAVSESRNIGIPMLLKNHPDTQTVLLDDAFQHRSVIPGLNILLSPYGDPFYEDYLLPLGRLREPRTAYERANLIVVSKCPETLTEKEQHAIISKINPKENQQVFFTKYRYRDPYFIFDPSVKMKLDSSAHVVLISAIANVDYLLDYLVEETNVENVVKFEDHHYFSDLELEQFKKIYDNIGIDNAIFLTTEKDAMRLGLHADFIRQHNIPIFALPIEVEFLNNTEVAFNQAVQSFLIDFRV